ncbi:hypothetical protein L0664_11005 [Octadecabacter sp. G9-8]|uniref:Flagellar assembly protein FliH/Type III secretion system HrpE domain-containing protein n=1 Tax=Octadecabacter dasysiphoniae TaxID=2909341 RepID=A0ABS9CZV0_9RHOB|nr:hypothetical protein [Octadecabacter dasysiphoniae]MCF2871593.1 hypothetical protein [Octadecabacter dasysiphoniae]
MTLSRVSLESFEDSPAVPPKESIEFKKGFAAGIKSAEQTETANLTRATEGIDATLSDMAFGFAEARLQILERLRPLLAQISETILPQIAKDSFADHLVDVLARDFKQVAASPVQIAVHPEAVDHLQTVLTAHSDNFSFIGDATLTDGQALLRSDTTHILIDIHALTLALQTALNGLEPLERTQSNG